MLASTARPRRRAARHAPRGDESLGTVAVLTGCVMEGLLAPVNRATERVLEAQGYQLVPARGQVCCGALHAHAGDADAARALARENIAAFEQSHADYIAVNSAGCGAMIRGYAHLLHDDPEWRARAEGVSESARDVSELLAAAGPLPSAHSPLRITYDAPCHLLHGQRVNAAPLVALRAMDGLEIVPLAGSDQCCGSAGIYNLIEPEVADAVLAPKLAAIRAAGVSVVATGNPGCLMQIGAGLLREKSATVARHPVELIAEAYDGR
jgi:glycolate oxidase iron-sulfur subunit